MAVQTKTVNKTRFESGDIPTQVHFGDLIDSFEDKRTTVVRVGESIQAAIDSIAGFPGGTVWLEGGRHTHRGAAGGGAYIIKDFIRVTSAGDAWIDMPNGGNCNMFQLEGPYTSMWELSNLKMNGNAAQQAADTGVDATNFKLFYAAGNALPSAHNAYMLSICPYAINSTHGRIHNCFFFQAAGDAIHMGQLRGSVFSDIATLYARRRPIFARAADSNFSNCDFGASDLGGPIFHGSCNRMSNVKAWGGGSGVNTGNAMVTRYNAIQASLNANDGTAGYPYTAAGPIYHNNMAGSGILWKEAATVFHGTVQDTDGTGFFANSLRCIIDLVVDRAGEVKDQWTISSTMSSSGGLPAAANKFGVYLEGGDYMMRVSSQGSAAVTSRPLTGVNIAATVTGWMGLSQSASFQTTAIVNAGTVDVDP